jgi:hypothetical protein
LHVNGGAIVGTARSSPITSTIGAQFPPQTTLGARAWHETVLEGISLFEIRLGPASGDISEADTPLVAHEALAAVKDAALRMCQAAVAIFGDETMSEPGRHV